MGLLNALLLGGLSALLPCAFWVWQRCQRGVEIQARPSSPSPVLLPPALVSLEHFSSPPASCLQTVLCLCPDHQLCPFSRPIPIDVTILPKPV